MLELPKQIPIIAKKIDEKIKVLKYLHKKENGRGSLPEFISEQKDKKNYQKWHQHFENLSEASLIKKVPKNQSDKNIDDRINIYELVNTPLTNILLNLFPPKVYSFYSSEKEDFQEWKDEKIEKKLKECIPNISENDIKIVIDRTKSVVSMLGFPTISKGTLRVIIVEVMRQLEKEEKDGRFEEYAYQYEIIPLLKENIKKHKGTADTINTIIAKKAVKKCMMSNLPLDVQKALWRIYEKPEKSGFFYLHGARQLINPLNIAHDIRIIFAEGIKTSTTYTKRYAKHFDSALSQIIELLMFTQPDIGGTQCIEHLNYFVAPYYRIAKEEDKLNEFIIKNILQGFIEGLSREFVARTTDPIYSGLILDTSPKYVDRMSVVYAGNEHTNEKYENYNEEAKSITETIFKICSEESMYEQHRQFPRIFLRTTKEELKSNKELLDCLFNAACKMQSVYLINMDADINKRDRMPPTYFPDLSRVRRNEKREYTCPGHIQSATIYLPNFVGASNTELETPQQKEAIDIFLRILEWKKKKIKERINENDFFILGNNHAIMGNTPYFSSADPPATVRFYGIHRLTDKKGTETKNRMFIHNPQNFFSSLRKKHADFFTLAQTPMESGAITRFNYEGSLQNKSALFSPICFPLREKEKIIKEQITHEGLLQKEMEGGSALRIFITPSASYDAGGFLKNLLICMTKDIPLINIRRADRNISGGIVE